MYNLFDLKRYMWQGSAISAGKHTLVFDFKYDGPGPAKGGTGVLSVDGKELARKTIPHTMPLVMTFFETFDVGVDTRTPVDESYEVPFRFTGKIDKLTIKVGPSQLSEAEKQTAADTITESIQTKKGQTMSQNHFTLSFPLKSPADAKALAEQLPPLMPGFSSAQDAIGTIHYSRFTVLSEKTLLFLGDFDGEFADLMADLAKQAGPVFDAIFQHVVNPPPTPVADHADAFVEWTAEHLLQCDESLHRLPRRDRQGDQGPGICRGHQWRR